MPATRVQVHHPRTQRLVVHAVRPHQWLKNLLLFVPLVLAHVAIPVAWAQAGVAFLAMCLASSGAYVVNDLMDVDADRIHPTKRHRAFAAGLLSPRTGAIMATLLLAGSLATAFSISLPVGIATIGYVAATFAYSIWLKTVLAIDVLVLAALYCLRLQIGGLATNIAISPWTFTFAMFLFVSLALMKRYAELYNARAAGALINSRRGYRVEDLPAIASLGCASGTTAVLVIALYVNADDIRSLYTRPDLLWGICVLVLLWIMRLWLLTNRGEMHEDPVLYALRDGWSIALAFGAGVLLLASI